jgi:hypothetical protein
VLAFDVQADGTPANQREFARLHKIPTLAQGYLGRAK